jgi:hypothetical protein
MTDIGTVLGALTPRETTVRVCVSGEAAAGLERAIEVARSARRGKEDTTDADATVDAARETVAASTFGFTFRAISAKDRSDLVAAHPSPDKGQAWDMDTLPPALVAASCTDPVMSPEQAAELMNGLSEGDRAELFNAAWSVNYDRLPVPFS